MTKHAAILLAPGFEEAEAFIIIDILNRLKVKVTTVACHDRHEVASYHAIRVCADTLLSDVQYNIFDAVVIPGGPEGTVNLAANPEVKRFITRHDEAGKLIAPICSAAARVLGNNHLLKGRRYTCSGELYKAVTDGIWSNESVVEDGNLISGKGLGKSFEFAFQLAWRLTGDTETADFQADHIYFDHWRSNQGIDAK
ncbi:DJ-1/PfpI family protein [Erwinia tracheiphila]|uniref:DJ-1/PfpI family protein n=1 Tax=Erwinia tracheiphila TaxID=65700 RepID=A0A345CPD1_9GAMM|nr:DJ-1 family glyoxalase III [Erwinia tracheiphila]AXF75298.1 DJ-1/PfpI family protein [Erwinia tracheiphila]UIA85731.1 DJ-1/PfpI family protein [Erwinia tracheiphila]UIA94258.1 DJ-1/PfpI family protein [Erwinia tracheiphila]